MKYHDNPSSRSGVVPCGRTDRRTDAFRNFASASNRSSSLANPLIIHTAPTTTEVCITSWNEPFCPPCCSQPLSPVINHGIRTAYKLGPNNSSLLRWKGKTTARQPILLMQGNNTAYSLTKQNVVVKQDPRNFRRSSLHLLFETNARQSWGTQNVERPFYIDVNTGIVLLDHVLQVC